MMGISVNARSCVLATVIAVAGCDQFEIADQDETESEIPPAVQEAMDRSCAYAGCHDNATRAGQLALTPGQSEGIIGGPSVQSSLPLVEIGDVPGSYFAIKMLPEETLPAGVDRVGTLMPPIPTDEELVDVAVMLGWIAGAQLPTSPASGSE